ncbi:virulence factor TspB C-terminal domain-related protein [Nitrosomonas sp.]|uniref:virulence factor TspB C-terminal domain-related protein n=1 Tax=Nitrosomonas sp. TaxID=42353 RepID=UPI0025D54443|nr:virulence factor TspB C-terminal domain-related protein [Nitrosomonas sp.]MBV6446695.1 hypothetical protein [Nitrosomonas sp.]MBV6446706.1 hypothetical protein [Nitrosomonas sp.]
MAHYHRLIFLLCCLYPSITFATLGNGVGEINLGGWIKQADGTYAKAFTNPDGTSSTVKLTSAPKGITGTSTALVQTSKGTIGMDIQKTVNVATSRLGPAVVAFAKKAGPLGMALTAASLVCDLTTICNHNGVWQIAQYPPLTDQYRSMIGWTVNSTNYPDKNLDQALCASTPNCSSYTFDYSVLKVVTGHVTGNLPKYYVPTGALVGYVTVTSIGTYVTPSPSSYSNATDSDWTAKQSLLNDDRFTPHLIDAGESVPTDAVPTLTPGQKRDLGKDVEPTKDSSGNITGRKETTTAAEVVDNGTADKPGSVIIKETKVTNYYDNSNTLINSETSTSYTNQPDKTEPSPITISFDTVPEATLPTYNVPNTFTQTSWGIGVCPPDIDVVLTNFSFVIPTAPFCNFAEMINPFVLLLGSLSSAFIISGTRGLKDA